MIWPMIERNKGMRMRMPTNASKKTTNISKTAINTIQPFQSSEVSNYHIKL